MFTWLGLALQLLKLVNSIVMWVKKNELIKEGYDKAIAEETLKILANTARGKAILEKVNAMSDDEVDAALRDLEPK
jgi:hypothetical protein